VIRSATVNGAGFRLDPAVFPLSLGPHATTSLTLRFSSSTTCNPCTGDLIIASSDRDQPVLNVPLKAVAVLPPKLRVAPDTVQMVLTTAPAPRAMERTARLQLHNTGGRPLRYAAHVMCKPARIATPAQASARGGPDRFGYTFRTSDTPGGPRFDWVDILHTGQPLSFASNTGVMARAVPIGCPFPFYGHTFTTVNISPNGWLSFTDGSDNSNNVVLPGNGPENLIALYWGVLQFSTVRCYNNDSRCIVVYNSRLNISYPYAIQAILYRNGAIEYHYASLDPRVPATVGIQDGTKTNGLTAFYNSANLHGNLAIEFDPPAPWMQPPVFGGVVPPGGTVGVPFDFDPSGLRDSTYTATIEVESNDAAHPVIDVPVLLRVSSGESRSRLVVEHAAAPPVFDLRLTTENPTPGPVRFQLLVAEPGPVEVTVVDIRGAVTRRLVEQDFARGSYGLSWDRTGTGARRVSPGIYFIHLRAREHTVAKRIVLLP
jgi:hypothetical protein